MTSTSGPENLDMLKDLWKTHKPLFFRQVLGWNLKKFQAKMVQQKGALRLGRNITMRLLPRDSGKTWAGTVGDSIHEICFDPDTTIQIIAEAQPTADRFLSQIKGNFESHPTLRRFFGNHVSKDSGWATRKIVSSQRRTVQKEATVEAFGQNAAIVGTHVKTQILDDVSTEKTAASVDKRDKLLTQYYKVWLPTLNQGGTQKINGTRYFPGDLYETLIDTFDDPEKYHDSILYRVEALRHIPEEAWGRYKPVMSDFVKLRYDKPTGTIIRDNQIKRSYFPEQYTADKLEEMRILNPVVFDSQYQNNVRLMTTGMINEGALKIIPASQMPPADELIGVVAVDPAGGGDPATKRKGSTDYFATVSVLYHQKTGLSYVFRCRKQRLNDPFKMWDAIMQEYLLLKSIGIAVMSIEIESNNFQSLLARTFRLYSNKYGLLPVTEARHTIDKVQRFVSLLGIFNSQRVIFLDSCVDLLENTMRFPKLTHDDDVDALMGALEALTCIGLDSVALPISIVEMALSDVAVMSF